MNVEAYQPGDPVKRFVRSFMILNSEHGGRKQLLPSTSIVMALRIGGKLFSGQGPQETILPSGSVSGLRSTPRIVRYAEGASILLVFFREGGAAGLFKRPIHELFGSTETLDDVLASGDAGWLEERVGQASTNWERVAVLEEYFTRRLQDCDEDLLVAAAIRRMKDLDANIRIRDLVEEMPISIDGFEKRFRRAVGSTPKQFLSIVRMRSLIDGHTAGTKWVDDAYSAGYFDQAHFIKNFKRFTGQTPGTFSGIPSFEEARG